MQRVREHDWELDRSLADIFAVRINVERELRFRFERSPFAVLHFFEGEMAAEINGGEKAEQFEGIHAANHADVELSVVEFALGAIFMPPP